MGAAGFKLFESHGEFTMDTSAFAQSFSLMHQGMGAAMQDMSALSRASVRLDELTARFERAAAASKKLGDSGAGDAGLQAKLLLLGQDRPEQIIQPMRAVNSEMAMVARSGRAMGEGIHGGYSRGAAGVAIFEHAVRGALRSAEGMDRSTKHIVHGLSEVAGTMMYSGAAILSIPGAIIAGTALVSGLISSWSEEAEEARKRIEALYESIKKISELKAQAALQASESAGAANAADSAHAMSKSVDLLKQQREEIKKAIESFPLEITDENQQHEKDKLIKKQEEFDRGRVLETAQQETNRRTAQSIQDAQNKISTAHTAVESAVPDKRAELIDAEAKAIEEFRAIVAGMAADANTRPQLQLELGAGVDIDEFLKDLGARADATKEQAANERAADANQAAFDAADKDLAAYAQAEADQKGRIDAIGDALDDWFESIAESISADRKTFDDKLELLGKTPEEKKKIQDQRELDSLIEQAKSFGMSGPQIDDIRTRFAKEIAQTSQKQIGGFVGLKDAHNAFQAQILEQNSPATQAAVQTAINTKVGADAAKEQVKQIENLPKNLKDALNELGTVV